MWNPRCDRDWCGRIDTSTRRAHLFDREAHGASCAVCDSTGALDVVLDDLVAAVLTHPARVDHKFEN